MKYYVISGEASGDLHGSNLIKELKELDNNAEFRAWGGDLMQSQGATIVKHYKELAFMGFVKVLLNIRTILKNFKICKRDILEYNPDVVILVDYPGFNLRMAKFAKQSGFKVFYYISPTIWAWHKSRVYDIKRYVDKMFAILPFEKDFYKKFDYVADFEGHPTLDAIDKKLNEKNNGDFLKSNSIGDKPIIAVLPGSRKQEIDMMLTEMINIVKEYKDYQFVIAGAPSIDKEYYSNYINGNDIKIVYNQTYDILKHSTAAIVTSGTATLETALFNVPEIVCYKTGKLTYFIAKRLVDIKYISLVNLIMDKLIVTELVQNDMTSANIKEELDNILFNENYRNSMLENYSNLETKLGGPGASKRIACLMHKYLTE
jgi:lipid-A-disaccharide synthase